jgi:hypothetical protein
MPVFYNASFALAVIKFYGAFKSVIGFVYFITCGSWLFNPQQFAKLGKKQLIIGTFRGAGGFPTGDK